MTAKDTFREQLAAALEAHGAKLAVTRDHGISQGYLYDILAGRKTPSLERAERLAHAAGLELWQLLAPPDVVERERKRRARKS